MQKACNRMKPIAARKRQAKAQARSEWKCVLVPRFADHSGDGRRRQPIPQLQAAALQR